jgi:hypothetical protein
MQSSPRGVLALFVAAGAGLASALIALSVLGGSPLPVWRLVALAIGAHLPYGLLLLIAWRRRIPGGVLTVIGGALILRMILVFSPPVFSDDIYRYVWDGRVLGAGQNPYAFAPADPALAGLRDDQWSAINNPTLRTIYPPFAQAVFAATAAAWPDAHGFKLLSALADVSVAGLIIALVGGRWLRRRDGPDQAVQRRAELAGACYAFNPIACVESGMSGHLEPLALVPMLGALLLLARGRELPHPGLPRSRVVARWTAPIALGVGCATKIAPLLIWPICARRDWRFWLLTPLVVAALYLPFSSVGTQLFETLGTFARAWEGNAGGFALLKAAGGGIIGWIAGVDQPSAIVHVTWLDGPARALQGTFFSLHVDGGFDPARPGAFTLGDLSLAAAKLAAAGVIGAVLVWTIRRRLEPLRAGLWLFGALLLVSPVVHPWYLLWVLPFAAALRAWPWLVLGAAMPLSYLPLDRWWSSQEWVVPRWVPWVEYGVFLLAAVLMLVVRARHARASSKNGPDRTAGACG